MQFYAYLWLRADGTPYYAGKGCGKRAVKSTGHGAIRRPKDPTRILIFVRTSETDAFETEKELIRNWGRKDLGTGCLYNLTDGGDGPSGGHWILSSTSRANISAGLRGNTYTRGFKHSLETRAKVSAAHRASWASGTRPPLSDKAKARLRVLGVGRKPSAETRAKLSAVRLGRKLSPEHCAAIAAGHIGKTPSLETRAKMSAAKLGRKRAPFSLDTRVKMSAAKRQRDSRFRTNS